mmetsp:Transcript_28194/g.67879  ORF Transcript_28194/g.67879 Transcript_28194/m.67879 type:complete len:135 (+) Transcript_28194:1017-1421(+)
MRAAYDETASCTIEAWAIAPAWIEPQANAAPNFLAETGAPRWHPAPAETPVHPAAAVENHPFACDAHALGFRGESSAAFGRHDRNLPSCLTRLLAIGDDAPVDAGDGDASHAAAEGGCAGDDDGIWQESHRDEI